MEDELDKILSQFNESELMALLFYDNIAANHELHPLVDLPSLPLINEAGPGSSASSSSCSTLTNNSQLNDATLNV